MRKTYTDKLSALQCYLEVSDHYAEAERQLNEIKAKMRAWSDTRRDAMQYLEKVLGKKGAIEHGGMCYFLDGNNRLASRHVVLSQRALELDCELEYPRCARCGHTFYDEPLAPPDEARRDGCQHC